MRVTRLVLCGALLAAPAVAKPKVTDVGNPIPKDTQVEVKNAHKADAAKSDLTVPERKFVERAASDDIGQIELARLALDKSRDPDVRNYAQTLIDDHKRSLDQLKSMGGENGRRCRPPPPRSRRRTTSGSRSSTASVSIASIRS